jgi:MOSC domain-containing protein YiiM
MTQHGSVHQINTSRGGVPKLPVPTARLEVGGVAGDEQADRTHHGGPDQDLCLYSLEVIERLRAEGHPIVPGAAGENLTLSGLDWASMRPGLRIRIGAHAVAEVTWPATPCAKNARWFADRDATRMSEELHPGWSRWYARVLVPGDVTAGDPVVIGEIDP